MVQRHEDSPESSDADFQEQHTSAEDASPTSEGPPSLGEDPEAPEADAIEQRLPADGAVERLQPSTGPEIPEADAIEQAQMVMDEDEGHERERDEEY